MVAPSLALAQLLVYFRVSIHLLNVPFVDDLRNADSTVFQTTSDDLAQALEDLYQNVPGEQYVTVLKFEPSKSGSGSYASMDVGTLDFENEDRIQQVLVRALATEKIGRFDVDDENFSFRKVSTDTSPRPQVQVQGHSACAEYEFQCKDKSCIDARRRCDGKAHCADRSDESKEWGKCNLDPTVNVNVTEVTVDFGDTIHLVGYFENLGNGTLLWMKENLKIIAVGNAVVIPDSRISVKYDEYANKYDLFIQRAKEKDAGTYTMVVDLREKKLTAQIRVHVFTDGLATPPQEEPATPPRFDPYETTTAVAVVSNGRQGRCSSGYYECKSGHCLESDRWCDGYEDCPDKDDEQFCKNGNGRQPVTTAISTDNNNNGRQPSGCRDDEFRCTYVGNCISVDKRCNGVYDCTDCSDEGGCPGKTPCRKGDFKCESGECISQHLRCDGKRDCDDGSDEKQCIEGPRCPDGSNPEVSAYGAYYCWNSAMCPNGTMCKHGLCCRSNGQKGCHADQFECASDMSCISRDLMCNGRYDCQDGSDELLSICGETKPKCYSTQFQCRSGECVDVDLKCNRQYDCPDGSDESDCGHSAIHCNADQFKCNDGHCIDIRRKCDSYQDCPDNSDESDCRAKPVCNSVSEFQCLSGECIDISTRCDRRPDCRDSSDEHDCKQDRPSTQCSPDQFQCGTGHCLQLNRRCDGYPDCPDKSDEERCPSTNNNLCLSDEFQCRSGECVSSRRKCDGVADCQDSSDEHNCPTAEVECRSDQFRCPNRQCISLAARCDRRNDCPDGYDESNCPAETIDESGIEFDESCDSDEFECTLTKDCISLKARCDGVAHCSDASDESNCEEKQPACRFDEFSCGDHRCIPSSRECDGYPDCSDRSDERNCPGTEPPVKQCAYNEFTCRNSQCIPSSRKCDGFPDCYDNSDESDCSSTNEITPVCTRNEFRCNDGQCVDARHKCNGNYDCRDYSDELDCEVPTVRECRFDEFECRNGVCIDTTRKCDKRLDCHDGSDEDEALCGTVSARCSSNQFHCSSGECIYSDQRCDGKPDCRDRSDEHNCPGRQCSSREFQCRSGECVDVQRKCDQYPDCRDSSDEENCVEAGQVVLTVYPGTQHSVETGRQAELTCLISPSEGLVAKWSRPDGASLPQGVQDRDGRLTIVQAQVEHAGAYVCSASSGGRVYKEIRVYLTVDTTSNTAGLSVGRCGTDEATCRSGECVKRESLCDGEYDCRDRSDELNCGPQRQCEPNEFQCSNRKCIQKMWVCDSEDDCGDNSDERACGTKGPYDDCHPYEFKCGSGRQCVPKSYQCDGQNDCQDGSDEFGCSEPTITQPPEREKNVCQQEVIVITCRAVGVPTPHINWRLNWGPVCGEPRCTQTSEGGFGTLTIRDANDRDQGAYSCEAINVKKRVLAVPDSMVTVRNCREPPPPPPSNCNPYGTAVTRPDGSCQCKLYVVGPDCGQCAPGTFSLGPKNPYGCIRCFGMGVTKTCQSADYYRTQEKMTFRGDDQGITVSDFSEGNIQTPRFEYNVVPNCISVTSVTGGPTLYWRMPQRFLGNKLTAYGGQLKFVVHYQGYGQAVNDPLVVLKGNEITLVYKPREPLQPDRENRFTIDMFESSWTREDGRPATREHLLMVLANLETFLIRYTHCQGMQSSSLGEVSFDIGVRDNTGQEKTFAVENCDCPREYIGLSCEECAPGYERSGGGLYLGTCVPAEEQEPPTQRPSPGECDRNGAVSTSRDPRTGRCECKEYATGDRCDQCKPHSFWLNERNPGGCISCFCSGVTRECDSTRRYRQTITVTNFRDLGAVKVRTREQTDPFVSQYTASEENSHLVFREFSDAPYQRALYIEYPLRENRNLITSYGGYLRFKVQYSGSGAETSTFPVAILRGNDINLQHFDRSQTSSDREFTISIPIYENAWVRDDSHPSTREHLLMTLADVTVLLIKVSWVENMQSFSLIEFSTDHAPEQFSRRARQSREIAYAVEECRCPSGYRGTSCEECAPGFSRTGGGLYLGLCAPCFCNGHSDRCDSEYGECLDCNHNTQGPNCNECKPGYRGDATRGTPYDCTSDNSGQQPPIDRGCPNCVCHGHSPRGCDESCRCLVCEHNTEGFDCGTCKAGFYGNARAATAHDCQACPCPGAKECFLDSDGQVTCRGCPAGYDGRLCDQCAPGYTKDEWEAGRCKPLDKLNGVRISPEYAEVVEGSSVYFACSPSLSLKIRFSVYQLSWSRVGADVNLPKNTKTDRDKLHFQNVTVADSGLYQCSDGISSTTVKLLVQKKADEFNMWIVPSDASGVVNVQLGSKLELDCQTAINQEPPTVVWSFQFKPKLVDRISEFDFESLVQNGSRLIIDQMTEANAGKYFCEATIGELTHKTFVTVNVINTKHELIISGLADVYQVDQLLEITCSLSEPTPVASVRWNSLVGELSNRFQTPGGGVLRVDQLEPEDSGTFECQAYDILTEEVLNSTLVNVTVVLNGEETVEMALSVSKQVVYVGDDVSFMCTVKGDPTAEIKWEKQDSYLPSHSIVDENDVLTLLNVTEADVGIYRCLASTRKGLLSSDVVLQIYQKQTWYPIEELSRSHRQRKRVHHVKQ